jgi:DNA polymerase V
MEGKLDLNRHLIKHPAATFFVRVAGDSMTGARIHSGDLLIVDRSLEATDGNVVVAALDGELTVKRLYKRDKALRLLPANNDGCVVARSNEATGTLHSASSGITKAWKTHFHRRSPAYTTDWDALPVVNA